MTRIPIILRKENYRLWFEFYKIACNSEDKKIIAELELSKDFYKSWGNVKNIKFDDWWKSHQYLFEENKTRVIENIDLRKSSESLILEIPMNQSVSKLLLDIKLILKDFQKKKPNFRKRKTRFEGNYEITKGSEPKLIILKDILNIYRDVYLKNSKLKLTKILDLIVIYFKTKKIPKSLEFSNGRAGKENARRNLSRWMKRADKITFNVARGEFPGKY